jgi:hypothetical protein
VRRLGHAEVEELHLPVHGHEDVRRGDVAVDDVEGRAVGAAALVGVVEPGADVADDADGELQGEGPLPLGEGLHQGAGVLPVEQLHGEEELTVLLADVVDLDDVGVAQGRRDARLVEEHRDHLGAGGEARQDPLDHDVLLEALRAAGLGQVDLRHPPHGHAPQDLVASQALRRRSEGDRRREPRWSVRSQSSRPSAGL